MRKNKTCVNVLMTWNRTEIQYSKWTGVYRKWNGFSN